VSAPTTPGGEVDAVVALADLARCFEGAVPAVIATAASDGTPNVTYLSKVRMVDDERIALSNQFFSKTARNLAENPRASVLVIDPATYDEYRLTVVYERTERRGVVFERLREDIDALAALEGMQGVFKLRAADIYRVVDIERTVLRPATMGPRRGGRRTDEAELVARLAELGTRLARCPDLDGLVDTATRGLCEVLGYDHAVLLLLDERGERLYTIASHGYDEEGVGSEVTLGEGVIGTAAARGAPARIGNLRQMRKYSQTVRRSYEDEGAGPGREIPLPGLRDANSLLVAPAMALGELVGALLVEHRDPVAFGPADEAALSAVATLVANAVELDRARAREDVAPTTAASGPDTVPAGDATLVRFFPADGSTFVDGDYLIKGVAGRILWSLLRQHADEGRIEFTNREVKLDPSLELPEFRDNFESRLILLKRRLDERTAPVRIDKTGRGRFRLDVRRPLRLEAVTPS
jgi:predicted pyridoxine 5'-phosphate oxidase superfamily flavin-nucleotide-binding protein